MENEVWDTNIKINWMKKMNGFTGAVFRVGIAG
jgi:hypothetical protein